MPRRGRRSSMILERVQDPGKDLFAYLYLMVMVFAILLMMGMQHQYQDTAQKSPHKKTAQPGRSSIATVAPEQVGRLLKDWGRLFLEFGHTRYDPVSDVARLADDNRLVDTAGQNGTRQKTIYILAREDGGVLLAEYLAAFAVLNRRGIAVAFVERK